MAAAMNTDQVREHMEVVSSEGNRIGTVDHLDGDQIKLTKTGSPDGKHYFIPTSMVGSVDGKVHLSMNASEVMKVWRSE